MKKRTIFALCFLVAVNLFAEDPFWTLVMAGKNVANPIAWNKNIYFIGDDKALNCISIDGSFLWRRNTDGVGKFISVSASGVIFVSTNKGVLQAFSSQGIPIWSFELDEEALFAPYSSLDGRIFVLSSKNLFCFSQQGVLKWKRSLKAAPAIDVAETDNGEVIVVLKNGDFLRYSIFGHLNEEKKLVKTVSAVSKAPGGYLMACTDGSLFYYKTVAGSESVWQAKTSSPCTALKYTSGKYLAVCQDGSVWFATIADNEKVWFAQLTNTAALNDVCVRFLKDEIQIMSNGFGASLLSSGEIRWQANIPEKQVRSVITENGMLVGTAGKIINAYRQEVKFLRKAPHAEILDDSYDIIGNTPIDIPPILDSAGSSKFFNEIYAQIKAGTFSENEPAYAATLIGVLENKWTTQYGQSFNAHERAEAARLLGTFGSYEYRNYLIDAGYRINDRTILVGIIKGIGLIAYDPDGKTLEFLKYLIAKTSHNDIDTIKAICDALEQLAKFGDNTIVSNSLYTLFSIVNGKFTNNIAKYARQKIENIVQ